MPKMRLNKRTIDAIAIPTNRSGKRYYDSELACFGLIAYPSGRKSFFVEYGPRGRRKVHVLGPYGPLTAEAARKLAKERLGETLKGIDPNVEREKARKAEELTFSKWADEYLERAALRRRSVRADKRFLNMAKKRFGSKPLVKLNAADIRRVFDSISKQGPPGSKKPGSTPIQANRWLAAVRSCLQEAWRDGKIADNPAKRVKPNAENEPRSRVLSDDEMTDLVKAVAKENDSNIRAAFMLLIETGARVSEVRRAEWEHFDLERGLWTIPSGHSKSKRKKVLPLNVTALNLLLSLDCSGRFLLPGNDPEEPRYDIKKPWERIKERAGLKDFVIHDIRRTFGLRVARQAGVHVASKLLGHSDISVTTKVYAPLDLEELRKAAEKNGNTADVIPLNRKRSKGP